MAYCFLPNTSSSSCARCVLPGAMRMLSQSGGSAGADPEPGRAAGGWDADPGRAAGAGGCDADPGRAAGAGG